MDGRGELAAERHGQEPGGKPRVLCPGLLCLGELGVGSSLRRPRCLRPGEKERRRSRKVPGGKTRIENLRKWGARKGVDIQGDLRLSPEKLP